MAMPKSITLVLYVTLMLVLVTENQAALQVTRAQDQISLRMVNLRMHGATEGSLHPQECGPRCTDRCSATQYKKPCLFFCNKCCTKCLCVPPGTYGNKQLCPCYNNWKTKRGGPKCP